MLKIDGSMGEGGGQILRSALALSAITQRPIKIDKIRANRDKPGLARQHLCALRAIGEICGAKIKGDALRSQSIEFSPGPVRSGDYEFAVGTAGSTALVYQTVLWPLLLSGSEPSQVRIQGGTHNHRAPSFEFLARSFVPQIQAMGAKTQVYLERHGFYPAGGGCINAILEPSSIQEATLLSKGDLRETQIRVFSSNLPEGIARRELRAVLQHIDWQPKCAASQVVESDGPGNAVVLQANFERSCVVSTAIGRRGVRAEQVGQEAAAAMRPNLDEDVGVDEHLADQLLLPLALGCGGEFTTSKLTEHTRSNAALIEAFLPVEIHLEAISAQCARVRVRPKGA